MVLCAEVNQEDSYRRNLIFEMNLFESLTSELSVLVITTVALTSCLIGSFLTKFIRSYFEEKELQKCLRKKQNECSASKRKIAKALFTEDEMVLKKREEIVKKSFSELQDALQNNRYTSVEVLHAYQFKALEADAETNCVTEFIEEAEEWAKNLDQVEIKKPFHGIPISVKDNFKVKGYDCTLGLVQNLYKPADDDAAIISILKDLGAVPFVKTNVPQTLLSFGCNNPVFGITTNPYNKKRIPGGSSGGEGALIAKGGSILGLGSDIGGSGRIPAHMCGIFALKPTSGRLSAKNLVKSLDGVTGVFAAPSLMAKDVHTIVTCFRHLVLPSKFNDDPGVVPIPFKENVFSLSSPLRIGYYKDDGFFPPTPGCVRAVAEVKDLLEKQGHTLIKFQVPDSWNANELIIGLMLSDGNKSIQDKWKKDIVDPYMKQNQLVSSLPVICRKALAKVLSLSIASPRLAVLARETGRSAYEVRQLMAKREQYVAKFYSQWSELKLDAMIAPGFPFPAPALDSVKHLLPAAFCTMLYNFLDFPVGVVPVTYETEQDQRLLENYSKGKDLSIYFAKEATVGATGLPIAVQVISTPWKEEVVLRLMAEIEKLIKK